MINSYVDNRGTLPRHEQSLSALGRAGFCGGFSAGRAGLRTVPSRRPGEGARRVANGLEREQKA